ncbi:MAG: hypothetical protein HOP29_14665 [Phycisphaerales bacterium]|nr:hypothetical protein [Phycisphaerales bacterium]
MNHAVVMRAPADVSAMAMVAQANVVQLRTAELKRVGGSAATHDIRVPPPGAVTRYREALVDHLRIKAYNPVELHLRLHEIWGQFCLMCWSLQVEDAQRPPPFAGGGSFDLRCPEAVELKTAELVGSLWRLRFEQRLRSDAAFSRSPDFARARAASREIRVPVFGKSMDEADDAALTVCSCEYAGMLAAARWIGDARRQWGEPGIMEIDDTVLFGGAIAAGDAE